MENKKVFTHKSSHSASVFFANLNMNVKVALNILCTIALLIYPMQAPVSQSYHHIVSYFTTAGDGCGNCGTYCIEIAELQWEQRQLKS